MATVIPFRGLVYDIARVPDLSMVLAPPYDVISPERAAELRARHPHNIVRVDLPEGDPPARYADAATTLLGWIESGILRRDSFPAIYVVAQSWAARGMEAKVRWGFVALLRIEEEGSGIVLPHEDTMDAPRRDRADLAEALRAQVSPIFMMHTETNLSVTRALQAYDRRTPDRQAQDAAGVDTRVWIVADPVGVRAVCDGLRDHQAFIADGHHRYAAARDLRERLRRSAPPSSEPRSFDHMLAYFCSVESPGLTILPYHRVTRGLEGGRYETLLQELADDFVVKRFAFEGRDHRGEQIRRRLRALAAGGGASMVVYPGGDGFAALVRRADAPSPLMSDLPEPLRDLDVCILHRLILEPRLGIDAGRQRAGDALRFTSDVDQAIDWVDGARGQLAFLMQPPDRARLMAVAAKGLRMPQKSTYFHPKVPTGLVMQPLDPIDEVHSVPEGDARVIAS